MLVSMCVVSLRCLSSMSPMVTSLCSNSSESCLLYLLFILVHAPITPEEFHLFFVTFLTLLHLILYQFSHFWHLLACIRQLRTGNEFHACTVCMWTNNQFPVFTSCQPIIAFEGFISFAKVCHSRCVNNQTALDSVNKSDTVSVDAIVINREAPSTYGI